VNVLGIVHSMSAGFTDAVEDSAPEICAADGSIPWQRNSRLQVHYSDWQRPSSMCADVQSVDSALWSNQQGID
jgi:hypothetical protein